MTKPGTGCKDAPRAFALQLAQATNDKFGAKPTTYDPQLIVRHDRHGKLDFIAALHVDDIKVACPPAVLQEFIQCLEEAFGKDQLDITRDTFTNCGVTHTKTEFGYTLDQTAYIAALKPIVCSDMVGRSAELPAPPEAAQTYLSLLMALAFTMLTRIDLSVYIIALQRHAQEPKTIHIRRLNALVRYAQRHPLKLEYRKMNPSDTLEIHSDAGFRREEKEGESKGKSDERSQLHQIGRYPWQAAALSPHRLAVQFVENSHSQYVHERATGLYIGSRCRSCVSLDYA